MPQFDINAFRANFKTGARQYTFYIILNNPASTLSSERTAYLVKSGSVPEGTIEPIPVEGQGMTYKLGSTTTFNDWSITFAVDANHTLYSDMLNWRRLVHDPVTNVHGDPSFYMQNQEIWLLNHIGTVSKKMLISYAGPQTVGEITLDYSAKEIMTFDVTFSYLYYVEK